MNLIQSLAANASTGAVIVLNGLEKRVTNRERGDVPGWVLITLMTAGLVTILWSLAATQLTSLFTQAMTSVTGP